jgi:hypothetical protein
MTRFRADNTEGYTAAQLAELNHRYYERMVMYTDEAQADKSFMDYVAERVLAEFDAEEDVW